VNIGCVKEFFTFGLHKKWEGAKRWKKEGGGGERREGLPANPSILINPFAHEWGF